MKKDTVMSFFGLFMIIGTMAHSCNERDDLKSEVFELENKVEELEEKISDAKQNIRDIESEYIDVDFNLGRLSYDDWRDVVGDLRENFDKIKSEVETMSTRL